MTAPTLPPCLPLDEVWCKHNKLARKQGWYTGWWVVLEVYDNGQPLVLASNPTQWERIVAYIARLKIIIKRWSRDRRAGA